MRSRLVWTIPVRSSGQSQSATVASTIASIDSICSPVTIPPTSASAPSLITAARGSTVLTRMPRGWHSTASAFVTRFNAAFVAPYKPISRATPAVRKGGPGASFADALETFTIQPSPCSVIPGTTACARSIGACTFTSNMSRRRFSG